MVLPVVFLHLFAMHISKGFVLTLQTKDRGKKKIREEGVQYLVALG